MATVTLAESAKLAQDDLIAGVIENIITVNRMFEVMPFDGITGNALAYNRENSLGPVATTGIGNSDGTIGADASGTNAADRQTAKDPATFTQVTSTLTTILGDAEVNGLIQATRSSDGNDQTAVQIASKAKSAGRKYQDMFINGDGSNFTFPGLINLCAANQTVGADGTSAGPLTFEKMDEVIDLVTDKDGEVDWMSMNARTIRSYNALLRSLGGASINDVVELPSGRTVPAYRGIPIFRNDWIPTDQSFGGTAGTTSFFAGTWDDGARQNGIAGLTAEESAGIQVVDVGEHQNKDERIWRVKFYTGLALFSEKGLAMCQGITN